MNINDELRAIVTFVSLQIRRENLRKNLLKMVKFIAARKEQKKNKKDKKNKETCKNRVKTLAGLRSL